MARRNSVKIRAIHWYWPVLTRLQFEFSRNLSISAIRGIRHNKGITIMATATASVIKKVGGSANAEKAPKKAKRSGFSTKPPEGGFAVAMPVGFSFESFKPLGKKAFSGPALFLSHKAALYDFRAGKLTAQAADLRKKAEMAGKFGDGKMAKRVRRAEKYAKELQVLKAELALQGIDINALLAAAAAAPAAK
jgi:hypothetical protein